MVASDRLRQLSSLGEFIPDGVDGSISGKENDTIDICGIEKEVG